MITKRSIIALEFLVNLIIGIVIFLLFWGCVLRGIAGERPSEESYNKLIKIVAGMAKDSNIELEITTLKIEKEAVIAGFAKEVDKLEIKYVVDDARTGIFIEKPVQCNEDGMCICVCKKMEKGDVGDSSKGPPDVEYTCAKSKCSNFDFELPDEYRQCQNEDKTKCLFYFKGGFLFVREFEPLYIGTKITGLISRTIYIERDKKKMGVCEHMPCLEEEPPGGGQQTNPPAGGPSMTQ